MLTSVLLQTKEWSYMNQIETVTLCLFALIGGILQRYTHRYKAIQILIAVSSAYGYPSQSSTKLRKKLQPQNHRNSFFLICCVTSILYSIMLIYY